MDMWRAEAEVWEEGGGRWKRSEMRVAVTSERGPHTTGWLEQMRSDRGPPENGAEIDVWEPT
eukprot:5936456-Pyramimonas_sp.AAC.1